MMMSEKKTHERRDAAITEANKRRRIAKDLANKQRAQRKRAQRKGRQEMALLASPNFDPRFVSKRTLIAITRKHFGLQDTATRIQEFLDDEGNVTHRFASVVPYTNNAFKDCIHRVRFPLENGGYISIQQGASHYCTEHSVEILGPWHDCMQGGWSQDQERFEQVFSWVLIAKAAEYVDALEGRAP